ncbi:hypothetical protein ABPG72_014710 [Tetrahymena utriculariae]
MKEFIKLESFQTFFALTGPLVTDVLNIAISIKLLQDDFLLYPTIFGCFFCLEKLIIFFIALSKRQFNTFMLAVSDEKINDFLVFNISMKFILFFIQIITFYGIQVLKNVTNYDIINLCFASYFILGFLLSLIYYFEINNSIFKSLKDFVKYFVSYQTYLITISCMLILKDNNQISLGFYSLAILLTQQIFIYYYSQKFDAQNILIENIANVIFNTTESIKDIKPMSKYLFIINFYGKLFNFVIFLTFVDSIYSVDNYHLKNITNVTTVLLNTVFLIFFIPQIYNELFQHKVYLLSSIQSIDTYAQDIKHNQRIKSNQVMIYFTNQFNQGIASQTSTQQSNQCSNKICMWYYKLIEDASNNIYTLPYMQINMHYCSYHFKQVIENDIQIEHHFFNYCLERIENKELAYALINRIQQGHYNTFTYFKKLNEKQTIIIKKIIQSIYQINGFLKYEQFYLTISPQLVLYDLYSD